MFFTAGFAWIVLVAVSRDSVGATGLDEDAAGSAVDVDEAFTADGGADESFGGALYGEIKVGGPADGEVSIDFQFVVFEFDFDQLVLRYVAFEGNGASADEAQIEEAFTAEDSGGNTLAGGQFVFDSAVAGEEYACPQSSFRRSPIPRHPQE